MLRLSLLRLARPRAVAPRNFLVRQFSITSVRLQHQEKKDSLQDRESMNTEKGEYSQSGTDPAAAQSEDAAFNPDKTSPEEEKEAAGQGQPGNPLDASPANQELSTHSSEGSGGAGKKPSGERDKQTPSGGQ